jgi:hypothetical protein
MKLAKSTTIAAARKVLLAHMRSGVDCPVCNQFAKLYSRPIRAGMVAGLGVLYTYDLKNSGAWCHVEMAFKELKPEVRGGDWCKLRFWDMIEKRPKIHDTKRGSNPKKGFWRITELGVEFITGKLKVPERALIFNNECLGFSGDEMDVFEVLEKGGFDYDEIM